VTNSTTAFQFTVHNLGSGPIIEHEDHPLSDGEINVEELLAWYADAGVDVALSDEPIDRFAQTATVAETKQAASTASTVSPGASPAPPNKIAQPQRSAIIPDEGIVRQAQELAKNAETLEQLRNAISGFEGCNLKFTARSTVFADGNPKAALMLVGEAPGRDEDAQGLPFVGRSGQLLDRMLAAIGLDRNQTYISNVLPWRPPGNRTPTPQETAICRPFIERHIELVAPRLLMLIGGSSAKTLLKTTTGIMALRGRWTRIEINGHTFDAMPSLHPAYLLRNPAHKRLAWQDLLSVKTKLETAEIKPPASQN